MSKGEEAIISAIYTLFSIASLLEPHNDFPSKYKPLRITSHIGAMPKEKEQEKEQKSQM